MDKMGNILEIRAGQAFWGVYEKDFSEIPHYYIVWMRLDDECTTELYHPPEPQRIQ